MSAAAISPEQSLFDAVMEGSIAKVQEILAKYPELDINQPQGFDGNTPFLQALSDENLEIALVLLNHQGKTNNPCNPWKLNNFGLNSLHMLGMVNRDMSITTEVGKKKQELVMNLLKRLAVDKEFREEINRRAATEDARTPLGEIPHYAQDVEWLKRIYDEFTKLGAVFKTNEPLWSDWMGGPMVPGKKEFYENKFGVFTFEQLKEKSSRFFDKSALSAAVELGDIDLMKSIYAIGNENWLPIMNEEKILHRALSGLGTPARMEILVFLLEKGANREIPNASGRSFDKQFEMMKANPNARISEPAKSFEDFYTKHKAQKAQDEKDSKPGYR